MNSLSVVVDGQTLENKEQKNPISSLLLWGTKASCVGQRESSLFLLLGSDHANNNSAQVKHGDSTFNPQQETFRSVEKHTHK